MGTEHTNDEIAPSRNGQKLPLPVSIGSIVGAVVFWLFIAFFVLLAIGHLISWNQTSDITRVAAIIWLLIISLFARSFLIDAGSFEQLRTDVAGAFSRRRFASIQDDGQGAQICFGYELFTRTKFYVRIQFAGIHSISWHSGQATAMSGRDQKDWAIAIRFDPDAAIPAARPMGPERIGIYIVKSPGRRAIVDRLGHDLVDYLGSDGLTLTRVEECK